MADMRLRVSYEELGGDLADQDEALRSLVHELDLVPGVHVEPAATGPSPEGSRGVDPTCIQAILVSVPAAITAIQSLLSVLRSWRRRREAGDVSPGRLTVRLGEDMLELSSADNETTMRIVEAWLAAHPVREQEG